MAIDERLIKLGAVARMFGIAEGTARRWADEGKLPSVRLSDGHRWFDREAIERLAAERVAQGPNRWSSQIAALVTTRQKGGR
jgi:predicted site-specific integrase-resolvase